MLIKLVTGVEVQIIHGDKYSQIVLSVEEGPVYLLFRRAWHSITPLAPINERIIKNIHF